MNPPPDPASPLGHAATRCGHVIPSDAPAGLCPRCALAAALGATPRAPGDPSGDPRGDPRGDPSGDPSGDPREGLAQALTAPALALAETMATESASPEALALAATGRPVAGGASPRARADSRADLRDWRDLREIGEYALEAPIAKGGMGVVFRARHKKLGRTVAIKMLLGGVWADDDERARFRAEAELAASLEHENIVPIYEVGEHDGQPYYAMRFMEESLSAHVERKGRLSPRQAAALVATVARAVHFGHRHGVVHRDLKPANLLLDGEGRPYVGDFGVSRRLEAEARRLGRTATGAMVGTPGYMAPEQAGAFGGDLTIAVDVWGLGAVLYELLCGEPPFSGDNAIAVIRKLLDDEPEPPSNLVPSLDRDLETVCMKCLEKSPDRRYASALELALDLERVGRGEPIAARRLTRAERAVRWWRRNPWRAGAAVSGMVFLAALAVGSTLAARAQEQELVDEVLHTNAWVARSMAGAVDLELFKLRERVARFARDPALLAAIAAAAGPSGLPGAPGPSEPGAAAALATFSAPLEEPFDSVLFLDERGICRTRWPSAAGFVGRDLSFRDYAQRAATAERGATVVSSAFTSKADGSVRIAVATPIFLGEGASARRVGVLAATLRSDSSFGALSLTQDAPSRHRFSRKGILLARHDAEPAEPDEPAAPEAGAGRAASAPTSGAQAADEHAWMILVHPDLPSSGAKIFVSTAALTRLESARFDDDYHDALVGHDLTMLAGYATVGDAPFAVVVETPADQAVVSNSRWVRRVAGAGALAVLMGILVLLGAFAMARRGPRALAG